MSDSKLNNSYIGSKKDLSSHKNIWIKKLGIFNMMIQDQFLPTEFSDQVEKLKIEIENFKFKVALVGKFSAGKSTLINKWLDIDIQSVDLAACTSMAVEFHYAEKDQEKLVIHTLDDNSNTIVKVESISEYKSIIYSSHEQLEKILFVELHMNNKKLARYPELVLVDTPGFGSNFGYHEKALQHYIGEGVSSILCVTRISQVGLNELNFIERQRSLGQEFSILICQEALNNKSKREEFRTQIANQAGIDNAKVSGCSALEDELEGFEYLLNEFESQRYNVFKAYFSIKFKQLVDSATILTKQLVMMNSDDKSINLKKQELVSAIKNLEQNFKVEEERLSRDCQGIITSQVVSNVNSYLQSRREAYVRMVMNQQSISTSVKSDAVSAIKLALEAHLYPRFQEAITYLGTNIPIISTESLSVFVSDPTISEKQENNVSNALSSASSGTMLGMQIATKIPHPVAAGAVVIASTVIGALMGMKSAKENQQSEANTRVLEVIESVVSQLGVSVSEVIRKPANSFLSEMQKEMQEKINIQQAQLDMIEKQIDANLEKSNCIKNKTQKYFSELNLFIEGLTNV